jgi:hypothetical protein
MNDEIDNYRRLLLDQLAALDRAHREAAAPILKRLYEVEAMRAPPPVIFNLDDLPEHVKAIILEPRK